MRRTKAKSDPTPAAECERCAAIEPKPGIFSHYEGYLVCANCRIHYSHELTARRLKEDRQ